MTVISLDTCDSRFSARGPSRSHPTFRDGTDDHKEKAQLNLELYKIGEKSKLKAE